jgi:hypothetical protein
MRFPIQYVLRPDQSFRGYAGQLASGIMKPGDPVMVLPSGRTTRIKSILTYDGELPRAFPPMSVTVCLEDELDISRGDMLVHPSHAPHVTRDIDARIVWMSSTPLDPNRPYRLKTNTQTVKAEVREVRYKINVNSLEKETVPRLRLNDIGAVMIETHRPVFVDPYRRNRATGSFILIDLISNETVAAGMITGRQTPANAAPDDAHGWTAGVSSPPAGQAELRVSTEERLAAIGHSPAAIWINGGDEFAYALERALFDRGCIACVLPQRAPKSALPHLASAILSAGLIAIFSGSSPEGKGREKVRGIVGSERFFELSVQGTKQEDSVSAICAELERRGVLRRPNPKE